MQVAPRARRDGVIAHSLDDETVVYETATGTAHRLDAAATKVWWMADGCHSVRELALEAGLNERVVWGALIRLQSAGLLLSAPGRWWRRRGAASFVAARGRYGASTILR